MLTAIGLMSGTSLDGVDVAMIETDGERIGSFGPTGYRAYTADERGLLRQALTDAATLKDRTARPGVLREAERMIGDAHRQAVERFLVENKIDRETIDVVGFHGQTVLHRPHDRLTVQIGDGPALAQALRLPVVYDLRMADVTEGGQGAPLVPVYHRALVQGLAKNGPVVVVNIGGVANITYIDDATLMACDTGPGNALLDDFMLRETGEAVDRNGQLAKSGHVDRDWIARAMAHPFFAAPLPKSLDRNDFEDFKIDGVTPQDGAATLTALTAATIARVMPMLPGTPDNWIVVGGGANNPTLMEMLQANVAPATVARGDDLGWSGDAVEAQAFAFMAVRSLKGLPLTFPGTTGVSRPVTGGVLATPA